MVIIGACFHGEGDDFHVKLAFLFCDDFNNDDTIIDNVMENKDL